DIHSIVTGMIGFKGHVHVAFGEQLVLDTEDADEAAVSIDRQVVDNYLLQNTNFLAVHKLHESEPESVSEAVLNRIPALSAIPQASQEAFESRLQAADPKIRPYLLRMYANPVFSRYTPR